MSYCHAKVGVMLGVVSDLLNKRGVSRFVPPV
jgi:hypothetical protein